MTNNQEHTPNPVILREYDIRGTYGENLCEADATWLGERFGSLLYNKGGRKIVVCRDGRKSSPALHQALCEALIDSGLQVLDIGVGPTPLSYFAGYALAADATLMVTGSHNPKDDNGIKITLGNKPFFGPQIQELLQQPVVKKSGGGYTQADGIFGQYVNRLLQRHTFKKSLKIAWDTGNGAAGPVVKALSAALPNHEHILLFTDIDCDFPNHHPDPSMPKNMQHLIEAVKKHNCDIGFAFDGDGDRIGVVDASGRILAGDELVAILSTAILQESTGGTIIADVKCSNHTFNAITKAGGKPIMGRTGHSWIKQAMALHNAVFAGEMSGHMFFKHSYYGFDDGLYAAIFMIDYIQKLRVSFADLVALLPKTYSTPEIRITCYEAEKNKTIDDLKQKLDQAGKAFNTIDGVRVEEPNGWWLVRASNTQSALIIRAEGDTEKDLAVIIAQMQGFGVNIENH
jgi:phosphomannomutase